MTSPMRMVPVEPTREMLDAVAEAFPRSHPSVFPIIWSAMLAASPPPGELREDLIGLIRRFDDAQLYYPDEHEKLAHAILSAIGAGHE